MRYNRQSENLRFAIMVVLLGACFLMGGASRLDVSSLIVLQPLAAACAAAFLLLPGPYDWRSVKIPLLLLAALTGIMVAQLIPLPAAVWTNLPGHAAFASSATAAGLAQPWRPISLTPDLTLASLIGLVVPFAVLLGFASINPHQRHALLTVVIAGAAVSSLFGLAQVSGGMSSPAYLYKVTNAGSAVGLFSNRNHQALLLAMTLPLLAAWAKAPQRDRRRRAARRLIAAGFALFLVPLFLITGSRAGLVLGLVGLGCAALVWRSRHEKGEPATGRFEWFVAVGLGVAGVLVFVATIFLSRAQAIERFLNLSAGEDTRLEAMPILFTIARDFFPVGSGFGSFDPVFRYYEPAAMLDPKYLNHAHNDVLELTITGGLPGIGLAFVFAAWFGRQVALAWRSKAGEVEASLARVASAMILVTIISSLVDYPLRTPLMMAILAIACGWLGTATRVSVEDSQASKPLYG